MQNFPPNVSWLIQWILGWDTNISPPDTNKLRQAMLELGARDDVLSDRTMASLRQYSNKWRAPGMMAIWGSRFDQYKDELPDWIAQIEKETGVVLPMLVKSGKKTSGMIQLFGELTAIAFGAVSFEDLKPFLEARVQNGKYWQQGLKDERIRLIVPSSPDEGPKLVSSIPPAFDSYLVKMFSKWVFKPWEPSSSSLDDD